MYLCDTLYACEGIFFSNEEYNQINSEYYSLVNVDVCVNETHASLCTMDRFAMFR